MMRKILTVLFRPSPLKVGLLAVLLMALLCIYASGPLHKFIRDLDHQVHDFMFKLRGPEEEKAKDVVIVDIDEESLQQLGQWPWPRTVMAKIMRNIAAARAKVIGTDLVFAEPDRTSPRKYVDFLKPYVKVTLALPFGDILRLYAKGTIEVPKGALDNDEALIKALEESSEKTPIILGYMFNMKDDGMSDEKVDIQMDGSFTWKQTREASKKIVKGRLLAEPHRPVLNLEDFGYSSSGIGFYNVSQMEGGVIHDIPLVMQYYGDLYPSLSFNMLRARHNNLSKVNTSIDIDELGIKGIGFENKLIVTDYNGNMTVNYRGPQKTFRYISAVKVWDGTVDPEALRDKYVLIGASATGIFDLRSTPFDFACPGVEIHANVISNILHGDSLAHLDWDLLRDKSDDKDKQDNGDTRKKNVFFILRKDYSFGIDFYVTVLLGVILALILTFSKPLYGGFAGLVLVAGLFGANYYLMFTYYRFFSFMYPFMTLILVFIAVTLFNFFFEGREKRFVKGAFSQYLSPAVISRIMDDPSKLQLGGERRELSIFFSDLQGFTTISTRLDAHELTTLLNDYLSDMTNIILDEGGTLDKYEGDAIIAFWNAPLDQPDHPLRACRAAIRCQRKLTERREEFRKRTGQTLLMRIGIHTGEVIVGNLGSNKRFDYTVLGDAANLASRLEGANKRFKGYMMVSEATWNKTEDQVRGREIGLIRVVGRPEPVRVFEPSGLATDEGGAEAFADYEKGLGLCKEKKWKEALAVFEKLQDDDPLAATYADELRRIIEGGGDWDLVWSLTEK